MGSWREVVFAVLNMFGCRCSLMMLAASTWMLSRGISPAHISRPNNVGIERDLKRGTENLARSLPPPPALTFKPPIPLE